MIKPNTIFLDGRKIGTYRNMRTAGTGHINFNGFEPYEKKRYRVLLPIRFSSYKYNYLTATGIHGMTDLLCMVPKLTAQEIRYIDPNLMSLAVAVEEEEELIPQSSEFNKKQQELVNDVKSGYFIEVILVENWEIEKGLVEDPIIGKNGQYYFTLGDNFDSSDISLFISDAKENVMEKISYEIINDRHQHIEIYRDIRSNEFIGIVTHIVSNKFSLGIAGNGRKSRFFWLKDFNENLAQGYIKLVQIENELGIQVIDTYNLESKEEEEDFLNSGYIKVGYQSKQLIN
ncbi:hypothetical protein [Enterococcus casseliflavus]|uniref:hypothetical protein n=1 Tax=Enterococcus casseliflavus TaxID=37734 RepID=UPI00232DDA3A|nr:hypothetical protein [Enterococcus casseliflavus]MDB1688325.1 hypothetical protein [Enterococcus casseliflavus]